MWKREVPQKSGLYWLYWEFQHKTENPPAPIIQPILFYAATDTHEPMYTTNVWWYDSDENGDIVIDERMYSDPETHRVCIHDEINTYWIPIPQPDVPTSKQE